MSLCASAKTYRYISLPFNSPSPWALSNILELHVVLFSSVLQLRGVRVQNINIGGGMGGEIPDNKRLEYALQHLHGIGRSKAHHIVCELGVENKFVKDLSKRELYSIRELLSKYLIGNDLKKCVERDVVRLVGIQCYRGIRHVDNLPCRGQRTHTNARTRRSRKTFSGSR
ncbi:small subunit ribosomal protein S13 [Vigna unguiculata]|uniref:Small ribosomal subunit protein uS13m n=1 Tax=Vigna unguiculata TaxID=3917 RepID=A0A4D6M002_VIGUN|nr:small subunit ribosomal protein S13 [Vigna unguiculata]